jgi:endonuclease YncB( thermonuclease family)
LGWSYGLYVRYIGGDVNTDQGRVLKQLETQLKEARLAFWKVAVAEPPCPLDFKGINVTPLEYTFEEMIERLRAL